MKITPKQYAISLYEATENLSENKAKEIIKNFVEVLKQNNDLGIGGKIIKEYYKHYQKQKNISKIKIKSREKISPEIMNGIMKKFENQVEIEEEIDSGIIGGIALEINENLLIDGSINKKLENIRSAIK
jgi:F0F1-type ATP synthase delta subunit